MNCKPGDLAVVIKADGFGLAGEISKMLVGRIVKVTHLRKPSGEFHCFANEVWNFEDPIQLKIGDEKYIADGIADDCLRPIRDPGDDATDEMIQRLGSPNKQEQKA